MAHGAAQSRQVPAVAAESHGNVVVATRVLTLSIALVGFVFILNSFLTFVAGWPGALSYLVHLGMVSGQAAPGEGQLGLAVFQFALYFLAIAVVVAFVLRTPARTMHEDADVLSDVVAYIIRASYWAVLLVGLVDAAISSLRVEGALDNLLGHKLAEDLGRATFRGFYVHIPLIAAGFVIAWFQKSLGFIWLALLIVVAEMQIVVARFIFSYEQSFMADLVRFWYGALFLFASPYTLIKEGHVRVDILYAGFSERGKAWANLLGSLFLGAPLCWVVLTMGMWTKASTITGPMLTFEVTQSGYGMYVKYLLAGFLLIFALTMLVQFMSYVLTSVAALLHEPGEHHDFTEHAAV